MPTSPAAPAALVDHALTAPGASFADPDTDAGVATSARMLTPLTPDTLQDWRAAATPRHRRWLAVHAYEARPGALLTLPDGDEVLVGLDPEAPLWSWGGVAARLTSGLYRLNGALPAGNSDDMALGWALGRYAFTPYRTQVAPTDGAPRLLWPPETQRQRTLALAEATYLVRSLINAPANDMGPAELATAAATLAARHGAEYSCLDDDAALARALPMLHAVGRASTRPPRLIELRHGRADAPRLTLVGKGVCFDSGGLDLKPARGMMLMKKDMGGAAHVLGLAHLILATGLDVLLRVLIPAADNAVSGNAYRPLDVLASRAGLTVEVKDTDAEGRLLLADALALAAEEQPAWLIDIATLTGASRIALGTEVPSFFTDDDAAAAALTAAGRAVTDPVWRLPLHQPYRKQLKSKVADIANCNTDGYGGAIVAALFLKAFLPSRTPWLHLDAMAWNLGSQDGRPEGGEAQGLRATFQWLSDVFAPEAQR